MAVAQADRVPAPSPRLVTCWRGFPGGCPAADGPQLWHEPAGARWPCGPDRGQWPAGTLSSDEPPRDLSNRRKPMAETVHRGRWNQPGT